jgi:thioesterase domain-containing protein/acyl carrier protein
MVQPLTVDSCKTLIFAALATGGQLHIVSREVSLSADALGEYMQRHEIDYMKIAPSHLEALQSSATPERLMPGKRLILGGEASRGPWAARLQSMDSTREIINHYGPTETTVGVLTFNLNSSPRSVDQYQTVPVGKPLPNVRAYVLDQAGRPVPVGIPGELCIGGSYVARGYLNRPELTARAFVPDPFSKNPRDRIYRTGDLVRWLPDGNIEFLGRTDHQVKIRGIRVELGEIERVLQQHKHVRAALVMAHADASGEQRLVAYIVPHRNEAVTPGELREMAVQQLTTNMVPAAFVLLDEFPLNPHGKIDRKALPDASDERRPDLAVEFVAPRNDVERQLAEIWQEMLGVDRVGVHDNFFEIGGHSLLAVRLMARVRSQIGVGVPMAALFAQPTVAALAQEVQAAQRGETSEQPAVMQVVREIAASVAAPANAGGESLVQLRAGGPDTPLFCMHGLGGHVAAFLPLATRLAAQRPVYGLQGQGLDPGQQPHACIEDMAAYYLDEIRGVQARGPYLLAGWSMGGLIALETAQQLTAAGEEVALLAMLDTHLAATKRDIEELNDAAVMRWVAPHLNIPYRQIKNLPFEQQWALVEEKAQQESGIAAATIRRLANVCKAHLAANSQYTPQPYAGPAVLLRAKQPRRRRLDKRWKSILPQLQVEWVPGSHYGMLQNPDVDELARRLGHHLTEESLTD